MATMNISLPDALKLWAESRTDTGMYDTTSDYVRDLIRRDQERAVAIAELQVLIDIGLASGVRTAGKLDSCWRRKLGSVKLNRTRQLECDESADESADKFANRPNTVAPVNSSAPFLRATAR